MTETRHELESYSCFIKDLDCPDCASKLEGKISDLAGVQKARISIVSKRLDVTFEDNTGSSGDIKKALKSLGYEVHEKNSVPGKPASREDSSTRTRWMLTALSGMFILTGIVLKFLALLTPLPIFLFSLAIILSGPPIFKKGLLAIRNRSLDMNFLMTVAVIGAVLIGEWIEAASVVFLFSLANLLESFTISKARKAIESLMELSPRVAVVKRNGNEVKVPVEDVEIDELVLVKPGERIPVDGRIKTGTSNVDQSPITGESTPVRKKAGSQVFAGTINGRGFLEIVTDKKSEDTTLSRILHMVEEAQVQKAPTQRFIDRFSRIYTPVVVIVAVAVASLPPLLIGLPFDIWFYRALVLLVIACPCALVISTPVTIISGLASAARQGILVKGGAFLEQTASLDAMAFDKTGTVTFGRPEVTGIHTFNENVSENDLLQLVANLEAHSEHPLAEAILRETAGRGITAEAPDEFIALPGEGVKIRQNGKIYYSGNHRLFEELGICTDHLHQDLLKHEKKGETVIFIGSDEEILGTITLEDSVRPGIEETLEGLRKEGIRKFVMLTGDNHETARGIAERIGISEFRAELLPQDKVEAIKELNKEYNHVAMVGDGVNDAPALATASVGIAMGVAGSDVALETADIALMSDDLSNLPVVIKLSKKALRVIRENIGFALLTKAVFLSLAPLGFVNLWMAVAADMGASLIVIFNGLRLLARNRKTTKSQSVPR
jgi:Cd2+/Zn2+-exporting ATPase